MAKATNVWAYRTTPASKERHHGWRQAGIDQIIPYYVSRTYLTRHGAGPLPGEDPKLSYYDDTNTEHPFQGKLRFAPLDPVALRRRCEADWGGYDYNLVLTHCDQEAPMCDADLYFHGPRFTDASFNPKPWAS